MATRARRLIAEAEEFARDVVASSLVEAHRQRLLADLDDRIKFVSHGFDYQAAELAAARSRLNALAQAGDQRAANELIRVKERQRALAAIRASRLEGIRTEPDSIKPGDVKFLVHALVVPSRDPEEIERCDAEVEAIAVSVAIAYEEGFHAEVKDVSQPDVARRAGLTHWPGFDLLSRRPTHADSPVEELAIEVKGRMGYGNIQMTDNEWSKACNLRDRYWLYVVFDCATPQPRLVRVSDPFGKLLAKSHESTAYTIAVSELIEAAEV